MEIIHISMVLLIALLTALFAIRVYFANGSRKANIAFAIFAIFTTVWIITDFSLYQKSLSDIQTFLNRFNLANICFMILSLAYFVTVFPREIYKIPKWVYFLAILMTVVMTGTIIFTDSVVKSAFMEDYGSNFNQGQNFLYFASFASVFTLYAISILIIKFRKFIGEEKQQIKYIFYGIVSLTILNLTFNLFMPMVTKSFIYGRFGTYSAILLIGFTAYAILKAKAFDLKIILTEIAVVIINVISVIQIFISNSTLEGLLRALFAVIIFYGSYILLKSVRVEIEQKEELQIVSDKLAHANEHLKTLDQMKTEFVSLASHELLTPVSAIEGYLSMILDEKLSKVEDPNTKKYLDRVYLSAKRLARLIADMLNISRIEEGRLLVQKADVDLSTLVKQVVDEIKFKADEHKQKVVFENPDGPSRVGEGQRAEVGWATYGDADKIKEIVINVLGNAIKYSKDPGEIKIKISKVPTEQVQSTWNKIEEVIKTQPLDDQEAIKSIADPHFSDFIGKEQLLISVTDQGIGIPKDELPKLFKKFHRIGDYTTAESQGSGLGLYITRALVELHHGRIWADSAGMGKGSTFTFSAPDISDKQELISMEAQAPKSKEQLKPLARPSKVAEEL